MRGIGLRPYGILSLSEMGAAGAAASGLNPFIFNLGDSTFTPAMAIRNVNFYGPIIQGDWDGTGTPDVVTFPRGDLLGNQTQFRYANFDPYQGSITFLITPEWDGNDGILHFVHGGDADPINIFKRAADSLLIIRYETTILAFVDVSAWTAGTTYCVVASWDSKNTIDGTNYGAVYVNDVATYAGTSSWSAVAPVANIAFGAQSDSTASVDSVIELLHVFNRPLFDGTYGVDVGNGDEIALIYGGGTFVDPMIITKGIGAVMGIPTDCGTAFDSGDDHAWAWPRASNIPDVYDMWDGGLPGTPYAVEFDGSSTYINCGSGATLDDIPSGAAFTLDIYARIDGAPGTNSTLVSKGTNWGEGWQLRYNTTVGLQVQINMDATDATSNVGLAQFTPDGKYHLFTLAYDDLGDRKVYIAIDGVWKALTQQTAAVGNYISEAARSLYIGASFTAPTSPLYGAVAWLEFSNNIRHAVGTDFIPPRYPYEDVNTIEDWRMDEGTGATVAAQVTSPANDGTITSGSWSSIWNIVGTPVIPQSHTGDGSTTEIDFGSGANIDDLPDGGAITAEGWFRISTDPAAAARLLGKGFGWQLIVQSTGTLLARFWYDGDDAQASSVTVVSDNIWHHFVVTYDEGGDREPHIWIDGVEDSNAITASTGNYTSDAAASLLVFNAASGGRNTGAIGWLRVSDSVRYTDTFVPDGRVNPPGNDANAHLLINMDDGAGTTATDTSGNGYNGTITPGASIWLNTPDMTIDEPGARLNPNGYNVGSDGADDGIGTTEVVTAETDYAVFGMVNVGADGHGWPYLYVYDNTGAAQIGANYYLPRLTDIHTGGMANANLVNANGHFTQHLVGWTCYNITDGSSGPITTVNGDGTELIATLAGGAGNVWDTNDVYLIRPPRHYSRHPFGVDFNFVFRTPAACVSIDIEIRNEEGAGVIAVHSLQVLESLLDNGDMESLQGTNPELPTGWANSGLDAGETVAEAVIIHAGAQSMEWTAGASGPTEYMYDSVTLAVNDYVAFFGWAYGDGTQTLGLVSSTANRLTIQADPAIRWQAGVDIGAYWSLIGGMWRATDTGTFPGLYGVAGGAALRYSDDIAIVALDSITITATPANQANSLEGTGIRVDGLDTLTQPIPVGYLRASEGHIRFPWTPRHNAAELIDYGNAFTSLAEARFDANHRIIVFSQAANNIRLWFNDGGGIHQVDWACGGQVVAGVQYTMDIIYTPSWMRLYQDNVLRSEIVTAINFANIPTFASWGARGAVTADWQGDSVIG